MKTAVFLIFTCSFFLHVSGQDIQSAEAQLDAGALSTAERIEALNTLSRDLTYIDPVKAMQRANELLELSLEVNDDMGVAYAYRNLASIYSYKESYAVSMEYLQHALDVFTAKGDSVGIANCYISLGHTYRRLNNKQDEIKYHQKAHGIFTRMGNAERIGVTAHNLGESYFNSGDNKKSRELTLQAIQINDSLNNLAVLSSCYSVLGAVEVSEQNYDAAIGHFENVLKISGQLGVNSEKEATIRSLFQLAEIARLRGDQEVQLRYLLQAAEFSEQSGLQNHLQTSYNELITVYAEKNELGLVQQYLKYYSAISDSLNLRQLEDRYQLSTGIMKMHELSRNKIELEKVNAVQQQRIQNRNVILIVIALSIIGMLALLFRLIKTNGKLKETNKVIETQRQDLEVLNSTKDKFFNIVAHDLKSPLHSLKSFTDLLIHHFDHLSKEEVLKMGHELQDSIENTIKMADNLIQWARVQMKDFQHNIEKVNVKDLTSNMFEVYKDLAAKKDIKLNFAVDPSLNVVGDKNQLEFVVRNLINNAIKFTRPGGEVKLESKRLPTGDVQIVVSDNGVGIPEKMKSTLFSITKKQSTKGTAGEHGTGLGLIISHEFVKLNGGQIGVLSQEGKGTTFYVTFKGDGNA